MRDYSDRCNPFESYGSDLDYYAERHGEEPEPVEEPVEEPEDDEPPHVCDEENCPGCYLCWKKTGEHVCRYICPHREDV